VKYAKEDIVNDKKYYKVRTNLCEVQYLEIKYNYVMKQ